MSEAPPPRIVAGMPSYARGYEGFSGAIGETFASSTPAWTPRPTAPEGAPNVVVMVIDDLGYSDLGPFGGDADTPTIDALAERGVIGTNYHSAPVCSPARAALLTGVNPHRAGFATVAGGDPGFPGYALQLADDTLTLAEMLRSNGYATYAIGKWHLASEASNHAAGDQSSWPTQRGFDRYYGCLEGFTQFFAPNALMRDNSPVEVDRYPDDYYLTDDLTDEAIGMIRALRASDPAKPFFLYFAHNAMHGPLGAKPDDIAKYRGRYAAGWDAVRAERFARQKALGLFDADARMVERNTEPGFDVAPWDALGDDERALAERHMEVYAAMIDNLDQNLARLLAAIDETGELDNTIVVIVSDNGGTAEGGPGGTRSYFSQFIMGLDVPGDWHRDQPLSLDEIGGPRSMPHYPRGWAQASNTPFRLYKTTPYDGGIRVPLVFSWPAALERSAGDNGVRDQYLYATDVLPTILEACGVEAPSTRVGLPAKQPDGRSALDALRDPAAPSPRSSQYTEFAANRAYSEGRYKIVAMQPRGLDRLDDGAFRLYDVEADPAETTDLAAEHPDVLELLIEAWYRAAWHNTVFPVAMGPGEMFGPRRPGTEHLAGPVTLRPGTPTLERHRSIELVALRDVDIVIDVEYAPDARGVLVAHGDQGGGYVLYVEDGELVFEYNEYGVMHRLAAPVPGAGRFVTRLEARCEPGFRWRWRLVPDARTETRASETAVGLEPVMLMAGLAPFTGIDVGIDRRGPVSWAMHERHGSFAYSGALHSVRYEPGAYADDDPNAVYRAASEAAKVFD